MSHYRDKLQALAMRGYFSTATIEVTSRCNLLCRYCFVEPMKQELSTTQWYDVIDRLAEAGVCALSITGGELFLRPDSTDLLRYVFLKDFFSVTLLTNGVLISEEHRALLGKYSNCIQQLRISFFSHCAAVHDAYTGVQGSFEAALKNAGKLLNAGVKVTVMINLTEDNLSTLQQTKEFFSGMGFVVHEGTAKFITSQKVRAACETTTSESFYQHYFSQCSREQLDVLRKSLEAHCSGEQERAFLCDKVFGTITILPDGRIVPCVAFRSLAIGNVVDNQRPLQELYATSALIQELRSIRRSDVVPCNSCKYINYCMLCPGMMYEENGTFKKPVLQSCNYVRALDKTVHS